MSENVFKTSLLVQFFKNFNFEQKLNLFFYKINNVNKIQKFK